VVGQHDGGVSRRDILLDESLRLFLRAGGYGIAMTMQLGLVAHEKILFVFYFIIIILHYFPSFKSN
jgi:hypothetical protein